MIKEATRNDMDVLTTLIRESFSDVAQRFSLTIDNCPKHPSNCTSAWIESDISRGVQYFILYEDETPIGCVGIEKANDDVCFLERLSVLPDMRGRHLGIMLVRHALKYAASEDANKISIGIIAEQTELKEWYEQFGFIEKKTKSFPHLPFNVCLMEVDIRNYETRSSNF